MDIRDDDRALLAIIEAPAGEPTRDADGNKMIGPSNAMRIKHSLAKAGFVIVPFDPEMIIVYPGERTTERVREVIKRFAEFGQQ